MFKIVSTRLKSKIETCVGESVMNAEDVDPKSEGLDVYMLCNSEYQAFSNLNAEKG